MEVIRYETPESWDSKGMDWNAPDPANADYANNVDGYCVTAYVKVCDEDCFLRNAR